MDWFSGQVGTDASGLELERILTLGRDNVVKYEVEQWQEVKGSYSDKVRVRRCSPHESIVSEMGCPHSVYQLSGNPVKFLQGHNAFGLPVSYMREMVLGTLGAFPAEMRPRNIGGLVHPSRVDITVMIQLDSHEQVHEWLRHAGTHSRSRHGRAMVSGTTVYWNFGSRRWQVKGYCKKCEMAFHGGTDSEMLREISDYVGSQLRLELTLRSTELVELDEVLSEALLWHYFDRIEVGVMRSEGLNVLDELTWSTQGLFRSWLAGLDVRQIMPRRSFYRQRRLLLDKLGVDISGSPEGVADRYPRVNLDREFLRAREVKVIPDVFDKYLWRPFEESDLSPGLRDSGRQAVIV